MFMITKLIDLSQLEWAGLLIEADEEEVYFGHTHSKVSPEAARQFLNSCRIRYGIHTYMSAKRDQCARWVLDNAIKYFKLKREV